MKVGSKKLFRKTKNCRFSSLSLTFNLEMFQKRVCIRKTVPACRTYCIEESRHHRLNFLAVRRLHNQRAHLLVTRVNGICYPGDNYKTENVMVIVFWMPFVGWRRRGTCNLSIRRDLALHQLFDTSPNDLPSLEQSSCPARGWNPPRQKCRQVLQMAFSPCVTKNRVKSCYLHNRPNNFQLNAG